MEPIGVAIISAIGLIVVALIEHRSQRRKMTLSETESDAVKTVATLEREIDGLREDNADLRRENRKLRAELMAYLTRPHAEVRG